MAIFAIRDDDINYFSSIETINRVYTIDMPFIIPSLCITPRAGSIYREILLNESNLLTKASKLKFSTDNHDRLNSYTHDWRNNTGLVDCLLSLLARGGEIVMHGITHDPSATGFECESPAPNLETIMRFKEEIESTLGTKLNVFSPPNNSINGQWLKLLKSCQLDLVTSVGVRPSECGWPFDGIISMLRILPKHILSSGNDRAWCVCKYKGVKTIQSYPISKFSKENDVIRALRNAKLNDKDFVLAIHSYQFNEPGWLYELFKSICFEAKKLGYKFGTLSDILYQNK